MTRYLVKCGDLDVRFERGYEMDPDFYVELETEVLILPSRIPTEEGVPVVWGSCRRDAARGIREDSCHRTHFCDLPTSQRIRANDLLNDVRGAEKTEDMSRQIFEIFQLGR